MSNQSVKTCKICGETKIKELFILNRLICENCMLLLRKRRYAENKEEINAKHRAHYQKTRDQVLARQKAYKEAHPEKIREQRDKQNARQRTPEMREKNRIKVAKKRAEDREKSRETARRHAKTRRTKPEYKIKESISRRVNNELAKNNSSKQGNSVLKYLSYTMIELKNHLEAQFESWMTWNNRGKYIAESWDDADPTTWRWQIDHIIPCAALPYTSMEDDNFKKCWDLSNLRPLSAKENIEKGDKILEEDNEEKINAE